MDRRFEQMHVEKPQGALLIAGLVFELGCVLLLPAAVWWQAVQQNPEGVLGATALAVAISAAGVGLGLWARRRRQARWAAIAAG